MIDLILPREIQSGNVLAYRHWRIRMKDKAAWTMVLRANLTPQRAQAPDFCRVEITAYRKRYLDDDNLIAGAKHLRDALIHAGLIADDNRRHAAFVYRQQLASASPLGRGIVATRIHITPSESTDTQENKV